uniref:PAS fold-3 domain-containing protein n=1 Tax=Chromera velia CCMP2878 TaxID=1169474 RepID=A0A0G4IFA9_9ALVE|eukprot:Cvel_13856.t1-p1 / transcript=Cvel_13856.t1 / gene=Cvel_13856 / organism=Chromera_velia_CCMP2878 / gene_product=hypothetical protein / transcript_product=hypothetical protein / location=Cvel_scaffold963:620-6861(-) / protein_length=1568 / sequence_SO=supercontig / SO=protein_coding / is_pseudo=false
MTGPGEVKPDFGCERRLGVLWNFRDPFVEDVYRRRMAVWLTHDLCRFSAVAVVLCATLALLRTEKRSHPDENLCGCSIFLGLLILQSVFLFVFSLFNARTCRQKNKDEEKERKVQLEGHEVDEADLSAKLIPSRIYVFPVWLAVLLSLWVITVFAFTTPPVFSKFFPSAAAHHDPRAGVFGRHQLLNTRRSFRYFFSLNDLANMYAFRHNLVATLIVQIYSTCVFLVVEGFFAVDDEKNRLVLAAFIHSLTLFCLAVAMALVMSQFSRINIFQLVQFFQHKREARGEFRQIIEAVHCFGSSTLMFEGSAASFREQAVLPRDSHFLRETSDFHQNRESNPTQKRTAVSLPSSPSTPVARCTRVSRQTFQCAGVAVQDLEGGGLPALVEQGRGPRDRRALARVCSDALDVLVSDLDVRFGSGGPGGGREIERERSVVGTSGRGLKGGGGLWRFLFRLFASRENGMMWTVWENSRRERERTKKLKNRGEESTFTFDTRDSDGGGDVEEGMCGGGTGGREEGAETERKRETDPFALFGSSTVAEPIRMASAPGRFFEVTGVCRMQQRSLSLCVVGKPRSGYILQGADVSMILTFKDVTSRVMESQRAWALLENFASMLATAAWQADFPLWPPHDPSPPPAPAAAAPSSSAVSSFSNAGVGEREQRDTGTVTWQTALQENSNGASESDRDSESDCILSGSLIDDSSFAEDQTSYFPSDFFPNPSFSAASEDPNESRGPQLSGLFRGDRCTPPPPATDPMHSFYCRPRDDHSREHYGSSRDFVGCDDGQREICASFSPLPISRTVSTRAPASAPAARFRAVYQSKVIEALTGRKLFPQQQQHPHGGVPVAAPLCQPGVQAEAEAGGGLFLGDAVQNAHAPPRAEAEAGGGLFLGDAVQNAHAPPRGPSTSLPVCEGAGALAGRVGQRAVLGGDGVRSSKGKSEASGGLHPKHPPMGQEGPPQAAESVSGCVGEGGDVERHREKETCAPADMSAGKERGGSLSFLKCAGGRPPAPLKNRIIRRLPNASRSLKLGPVRESETEKEKEMSSETQRRGVARCQRDNRNADPTASADREAGRPSWVPCSPPKRPGWVCASPPRPYPPDVASSLEQVRPTSDGRSAQAQIVLWTEYVAPPYKERVEMAIEKCLRTGEPFALQLMIERPDGQLRWFECGGKRIVHRGPSKRGAKGEGSEGKAEDHPLPLSSSYQGQRHDPQIEPKRGTARVQVGGLNENEPQAGSAPAAAVASVLGFLRDVTAQENMRRRTEWLLARSQQTLDAVFQGSIRAHLQEMIVMDSSLLIRLWTGRILDGTPLTSVIRVEDAQALRAAVFSADSSVVWVPFPVYLHKPFIDPPPQCHPPSSAPRPTSATAQRSLGTEGDQSPAVNVNVNVGVAAEGYTQQPVRAATAATATSCSGVPFVGQLADSLAHSRVLVASVVAVIDEADPACATLNFYGLAPASGSRNPFPSHPPPRRPAPGRRNGGDVLKPPRGQPEGGDGRCGIKTRVPLSHPPSRPPMRLSVPPASRPAPNNSTVAGGVAATDALQIGEPAVTKTEEKVPHEFEGPVSRNAGDDKHV